MWQKLLAGEVEDAKRESCEVRSGSEGEGREVLILRSGMSDRRREGVGARVRVKEGEELVTGNSPCGVLHQRLVRPPELASRPSELEALQLGTIGENGKDGLSPRVARHVRCDRQLGQLGAELEDDSQSA